MNEHNHLILPIDTALKLAAQNIKERTFDPNSVIQAINDAKKQYLNEAESIKTSDNLIHITERICAVYSVCLESSKLSEKQPPRDILEYMNLCFDAAVKALLLCTLLIRDNTPEVCRELDALTAQLRALSYRARPLRMTVIARHKRIFSALPELEYIEKCHEITLRSLRLIHGCAAGNNMFTLCT